MAHGQHEIRPRRYRRRVWKMDLLRSAGKRSALLTNSPGDRDGTSLSKVPHDRCDLRAAARNSFVFDLLLHPSGIEPVPVFCSNITSTYAAYPLLPNRWLPSQGHCPPANSIYTRESASESQRLSLPNSLVPWDSSPAEYRPEGSNCQVAVKKYITAPHSQENQGALTIPTENDNEPLTPKSGLDGAIPSS